MYCDPTPFHIREICNRYCSQFQEIKNQNFKFIHPDIITRALEWQKQRKNETIETKNDLKIKLNKQEILIKDKDRNYRIVSKNYYLYHLRDDELDTEEELIDEEDWEEEKRIVAKHTTLC